MGIESIRIENFRTCRSVELSNLGHLTVLVGRNGVGKSNILQGIEWVAKNACSNTFSGHKKIGPSSPENKIEAEISFQPEKDLYFYKLILSFEQGSGAEINLNREESLSIKEPNEKETILLDRRNENILSENGTFIAKIERNAPLISALAAILPSEETQKHILPALSVFRGIRYYPLNELTYLSDNENPGFISRSEYLGWLASNAPVDSAAMRLINMYFERRDDFDELRSILGASGLDLISNIEIDTVDFSLRWKRFGDLSLDDMLYYRILFWPSKEGWKNADNSPSLLYQHQSYGTRRILRLLVSIFYDKNSVYLFEQPEDGIHPDLLRKLIDVLRAYSDKGQIIMASHSSALLDLLRPEEVRLVTMSKGETQVRALSDVELEGAKLFLENDGPLSEYLSLLSED
ncbi:AAA family ATPase [Methylomagnum sp.]